MTYIEGGSRLLTIHAIFIKDAPSGKAFRAILLDEEGGEEVIRHWFPHSQVKTPEGDRVDAGYGCPITICVPLWLAEKEGFDKFYKEQLLDEEYGSDTGLEEEEDEIPY